MDSESESNVSGFINYNQKNLKKLYVSLNHSFENVNEDLQEIERNLKRIVGESGCLENKLSLILQALPRPDFASMHKAVEKD